MFAVEVLPAKKIYTLEMWASIAAETSQKATPKLFIKYNAIKSDDNNGNKFNQSNIPRHREIEPHPSDDFTMTNETEVTLDSFNNDYLPDYGEDCIDYSKDEYFKAYVSALPYTFHKPVKWREQNGNMEFKNIAVLKQMHQNTKDLITGYIRNMTDKCDNNTPELLSLTVFMFYFIQEKFTNCGHSHILNEGATLECNVYDETEAAYGNMRVSQKFGSKYSWTLKIGRSGGEISIDIGIETNAEYKPTEPYELRDERPDRKFYAFDSYCGDLRAYCHKDEPSYCTCDLGQLVGTECILKFDVDTINKTMTANVDSVDQGIMFENMEFDDNEEYILFVHLDHRADVEIIDFKLHT